MGRLYSNLKFLGFPEHLQAIRDQRVLAPVHIRMKPTNRCNHDCWYCAYHVGNLQLGEDMDMRDEIPPAKMDQIITDVIDMGVRAVTFSGGGEPLLYRPLPECVERLAAGGIKIGVLTNGSNLKGRVADVLAQHGTWVRISMDGWDGPSYRAARGVPDSAYEKLFDNVRDFLARGTRCVLGVSFIIDHGNHGHIYDVCAQLKEAGVNHVKLSGVVVGNSVEENTAYHDPIRAEVEQEIGRCQALNTSDFTVVDHYHGLESRVFEKHYTTCPFLMFQPVIAADQMVYTCHDKAFNKEGLLGSIVDRSFKEFWFSPENRERIYTFNPAQSCRHHCTVHNKNLAILEYLSLDTDHLPFV
ncbi:radical SAM protein [Endothiovibrio diazotrophicus]